MKKTICITLLLISIAGGVFFASSQKNPAESCAAAVDKNFTLLSNAYSVETLLNSSPYAYIDNDFYRNIVSLGFDAVQVLQEKNADGEFSDLNSYIAAIAIQEITGCNLYSITGIDFESFLCALGHRLKVLHIHDNDGAGDLHQIPFTFTKTRENTAATDWNGFLNGLRRIHFDQVLNFETAPVLSAFPEEMKPQALRFIAEIGEYFKKHL